MPAMKDLVKGTDRYRHFIGGAWVDSTLKEWIEVENPATGETIASVPKGSPEDADRAVQAAFAAQPAWEALPPQSRGLLLRALAKLILENRERLAATVTAEQGKPLHEARGEIEGTAQYLVFAAEEARRITGDIIPSDTPDEQIWIQKVAHGVVVALTAWNYPGGADDAQDRAGADRGQHGGGEVARGDALRGAGDRRAVGAGGVSARGDQRDQRHRRGGGAGAGHASADRGW